jgi:hypothetical protein
MEGDWSVARTTHPSSKHQSIDIFSKLVMFYLFLEMECVFFISEWYNCKFAPVGVFYIPLILQK